MTGCGRKTAIQSKRTRTLEQWSGWVTADVCKQAVSDWARSLEFGCITEIEGIVEGRLDALLFPLGMYCPLWKHLSGRHWTERCALAGVEIKVEKSDFKNGLKGQFFRYDKSLSGLYIAGPADIVTPQGIPSEFGVLQIKAARGMDEPQAFCRRHPQWKEVPQVTVGQLWTILWKAQGNMRKEIAEVRREKDEFLDRFRSKAGRILTHAISEATEGEIAGKGVALVEAQPNLFEKKPEQQTMSYNRTSETNGRHDG